MKLFTSTISLLPAKRQRVLLLTALLCLLSATALLAQQTVTGRVVDMSGNAFPSVNVVVKGTTIGVITDMDGKYQISVPSPQSILTYSFIGYLTEEVQVGARTVIDVTLIESIETLEEIVVVGYGTQRRSDITGSISSVDEQSLREVTGANLSLILQGRAAGLEINRTSTRPGDEAQIRIRGNRSLAASNAPLLVVDGIPYEGSINDLNVSDIVSVDVLKDASATAIYGSRASNGVIIISTRRGQAGESEITYSGYYGISQVARKYEVFNGEEFQKYREISGRPFTLTPEQSESLELGRYTNWQDLMYEDGYITSHEVSTSGGSDDTKYSLGGGFFEQTTVLPGQSFTRYSLRATIDQQIGKRIRVGINTMNSLSLRHGESVSAMYSMLTLNPLVLPRDNMGNIVRQPALPEDDYFNPLYLNDEDSWTQQRRIMRTFNSLYGELQLAEGLRFRVNLGLDLWQNKYGHFYGSQTPIRDGRPNEARVDNRDYWSYTVENLLFYERTFNKHRLNLTGLFSAQERKETYLRMEATNILADYIQFYNLQMGELLTPQVDYSGWGILSYMGRANYAFDDRYLLTFTYRADGSSRLAEGNKWHYYPAVALGWNAHNESFLKSATFISNLKLRLGWGQTSNTAVDPYRTMGRLSRITYNFGAEGAVGYFVSDLPSFDLGWEFTTTTNVGLDFGFFRNRINGSFELYLQHTNDILMNRQLPSTSGISGAYTLNIAETENRGAELSINGVIISNPDGFTWSANANFFMNREKILSLADPNMDRDIGNGWFVGYPITVIYDYEKIGIWQEADADIIPREQKPGQIRVKDLNEDGRIRPDDDRSVLGSFQPDWQLGFTNRLSYKAFDLSVVAFYRHGGMLVSTIHQPNSFLNTLQGRRNNIRVDYWTPENPEGTYPMPDSQRDNPMYGNTLGYFDATFLKIRSINLGVTLPQRWLGPAQVKDLRLYFTVQDPFVFLSPYVDAGGVDPETTGERGTWQAGDDVRPRALVVGLNTPPAVSYIFGLNLKF